MSYTIDSVGIIIAECSVCSFNNAFLGHVFAPITAAVYDIFFADICTLPVFVAEGLTVGQVLGEDDNHMHDDGVLSTLQLKPSHVDTVSMASSRTDTEPGHLEKVLLIEK